MRLPIFITIDQTVDQVEEHWRASIRNDKQIKRDLESVSLILFVHPATAAVGVMYGAQYMQHKDRYEMVLNLMGWKWERSFFAPTCHAQRLRRIK
jgi:hypothetical protein